jgi:hypothetical protein
MSPRHSEAALASENPRPSKAKTAILSFLVTICHFNANPYILEQKSCIIEPLPSIEEMPFVRRPCLPAFFGTRIA